MQIEGFNQKEGAYPNPFGIFSSNQQVHLLYQSAGNKPTQFSLASSDDGFNFETKIQNGQLRIDQVPLDLTKIDNLLFSANHPGQPIALFRQKIGSDHVHNLVKIVTASIWNVLTPPIGLEGNGLVLEANETSRQHIFYGGHHHIYMAVSDDLVTWRKQASPLLSPRAEFFDSGPLTVQACLPIKQGNLLLYESLVGGQPLIGAAILDPVNPNIILWRSREILWKPIPQWQNQRMRFLGSVILSGRVISYWHLPSDGIHAVVYLLSENDISVQSKNISLSLNKHSDNPLIGPKPENPWEAFTTFNPAAIYENGKVHILYRAQGHDYVSVVGYASSDDGLTINSRHDSPCYVPKEKFEESGGPTTVAAFMSGGGFGGCEDPRLTKIGDRIYMTYVAFNGFSEPRIALTSISLPDFLNHRWLWEKPVLISPPGIIDKSAVLFPEKIRGKYVILHRVFPDILLDFVDNLEFDGSTWLKGEYRIKIRPDHWDSRKIGAGAPPLRTKDGWLLIYYSVDERDAGRYKIGAMLLDLDDPREVLYRTNNPILEPNERYENEGFKAGVAYPCGAVIIGPTLFVYYGAADTVVCVATANLDDFLHDLRFGALAKLEPAHIRPVK